MMNDPMTELLPELKKPFHPSQVYWKPGSLNEERTRALALAYADLRAYQNRLDEICGMDWSVTYTPWGDRIVCHLTIRGITRSSTGEPDSQSERSEIAGTSAEAQAFKRACAMFGLGRYLYNLPSLWVEYDPQSRSFTERARARLDMIVNQHYRRVMDASAAPSLTNSPAVDGDVVATTPASDESGDKDAPTPTPEPQPVAAAASEEPAAPAPNGNGSEVPASTDAPTAALRQQFDQLGQELYGEQWDHVSRHNVERISAGQAADSGQLTPEQLQKLIDGLKSLKRKRQRVQSAPAANHTLSAVAA